LVLFRSFPSAESSLLVRGEGVYLRAPRLADYEPWAQLREASRDFLTPWEPTWPADDLLRPAFRRRIRRYNEEMRVDQAYPLFLFRAADDALLGGLTLSNVRRGVVQAATLGYWMGAPHAGKGYMTAGVRAVIPFVFDRLRLHRLEAACLPSNSSSIHLLEKVGFTREGLARSYLCIDGLWQDHILYAFVHGDPLL
jgi:ribosomal-protein-alanine N-acetyltransferase